MSYDDRELAATVPAVRSVDVSPFAVSTMNDATAITSDSCE